MRHSVKTICFIASCITLSIACWDLYKNFPVLKSFLDQYFSETQQWLEEIFHENFAVFISCILYICWPLQFVYDTLRQSDLFVYAFNGAICPFMMIGYYLWAGLKLLFDLLWPIKAAISFILRTSWSLVWNIICLPYTIVMLLYGGARGCFDFMKSFQNVSRVAKSSPSASDA